MGCTITEINSDEELEAAKELYSSYTQHIPLDKEELHSCDSGQVVPLKRNLDEYQDFSERHPIVSYQRYQPTYRVVRRVWDIPAGLPEPQMDQPMWPFNFQSEFTDYSPKRIRTVYFQRPIVHVVKPQPHLIRYIPSPRILMPSPVVYRRIEPMLDDHSQYSDDISPETRLEELTDDEDDLTK
jgi:hypothetical protein